MLASAPPPVTTCRMFEDRGATSCRRAEPPPIHPHLHSAHRAAARAEHGTVPQPDAFVASSKWGDVHRGAGIRCAVCFTNPVPRTHPPHVELTWRTSRRGMPRRGGLALREEIKRTRPRARAYLAADLARPSASHTRISRRPIAARGAVAPGPGSHSSRRANHPVERQRTHADRRRNAFVITEAELRLIASAAIMGESSQPVNGYSTPAASGTPSAL